jgi:hypothetical protein
LLIASCFAGEFSATQLATVKEDVTDAAMNSKLQTLVGLALLYVVTPTTYKVRCPSLNDLLIVLSRSFVTITFGGRRISF